MKAGHYLKTDLEIITVTDLDGDLHVESQGRNILREKTFNSELGSLVNKIFSNEKKTDMSADMDVKSDPAEKNELLLKCEKLIYRLKHLEDLNSNSSSYNPFETDINVYDDIDDTVDYIKTGLLQCGYSKFQILKYNFNDKAYRSDINLLDTSYSSDMYFSTKDPIILRIQNQGEGFLINSALINSDPFFSKKFINPDTDEFTGNEFYIIKISDLFNDSNKFKNNIIKFEEFLSPLLLVELDMDKRVKQDEILSDLKKFAALPLMLYFLKNRIRLNIADYSYEETLLMIELFVKSAVDSSLKSIFISLKDYSNKADLFILKFVISKLRKILKKYALILKININSVVIVTPSADLSNIYNVIERANSGSEIIDMHMIDFNEFLDSKEFVNIFL